MPLRSHPRPRVRLRRILVAAAVIAALAVLLAPLVVRRLAGASNWTALEAGASLTPRTAAWLAPRLADLEAGTVLDVHCHLAGLGPESGCWVNPRMRSVLHPRDWGRYRFYASAAGVDPRGGEDAEWGEHLADLAEAMPVRSRHFVLAFDYRYERDGERNLARSEFYVPNEWAIRTAARRPERLVAAASIHPFRRDALEELERVRAAGVRLVKWLPAAQGIDLADARCAPFYAALASADMTLLVHIGEEQAVDVAADQDLGNPLLLRIPLGAGVRVIAAHCATSGDDVDLDAPARPRVPSFDLWLRLMDEEAWRGRLFGEISTVAQVNRYAHGLGRLLARVDLHPRLVNGSDWPLPAINVLYQLDDLIEAGLLPPADAAPLRELYEANPLLFDLALKRAVRAPGGGAGFRPEVFLARPELGL